MRKVLNGHHSPAVQHNAAEHEWITRTDTWYAPDPTGSLMSDNKYDLQRVLKSDQCDYRPPEVADESQTNELFVLERSNKSFVPPYFIPERK
ncbi:hypothetical protein GWI33_015217 [Rhynchophorus ferrugineus]|uniref:Uncharacterized protein n=1 Tax=Rhynchophorus ferrugineus TaxID=354439 RepID=A0A834I3Q7_RHYFE|nr:hypothetical protein GWI33_015217 [Rhynchophorus ferrugineus]